MALGLNRITKRLAGGVLALGVALTPAMTLAETLSDAMVAAYKNSGLLDQQRALARADAEDVAIAAAALRPVISYAIDARRSINTPKAPGVGIPTDTIQASASLNAQLTLLDFGQGAHQVEIAKENVRATFDSLRAVEQDVLLNAASAYLGVVANSQSVSLQANSVRLISQELRAARDRFEVGEITQTDVSLAEARLAAARSTEASAQGNLMIARETYKAAVGHYPNNLAALPPLPAVPASLEDAKAQARLRHPDLQAMKRVVTIADMQITTVDLSTRPTIDATASVGRTISPSARTANTTSLGINLSGPIYTGGRIAAQHRKAVATAEAQRANLLVTTQRLEQLVGNAWAQLAIANASIQATERQIRAATVALRGAREEATLGARTTLDVLNAEQELLDARTSAIRAQTNRYAAVYELLSTMGLLTSEHLNLGIATYDPTAYARTVEEAPLRTVSPQGEKLDHILEALGKK